MTEAQMIAGFIAGFTRGAIQDLDEAIPGFKVDGMAVGEDGACTITYSSASTEGGTIVVSPGRDTA